MPLNQNVSPYFNDFDETKHHIQVMIKPGVALQAREVNEIQSIISNQVKRFGDNIFADGAMVIPGQIVFDQSFFFVRLQALTDLEKQQIDPAQNPNTNLILFGTSGLQAQITMFVPATGSDPDTVFVKYISSGIGGIAKEFSKNEALSLSLGGPIVATVENEPLIDATGSGSAASIGTGVYYVFGYFVRVESQTIILDKYSNTPSYKVGLTINESFISSNDDPTLNDNATGTPNFAAPGADRYVIDLVLDKRTPDSTNDTKFIELLRLVNGQIAFLVTSTVYSILGAELARRTSETNGDFTINPFKLDLREHLKDDSHPLGIFTVSQGGDITKLAAGLEPGLAYVKGYRIQNLLTDYIVVDKARETTLDHNSVTQASLGNYVLVDRLFGFPTYDEMVQIQLHDTAIVTNGNASGTQIGTAYARNLEFDSGAISNGATTFPYPLFKLFLFNISLNFGKTLNDVRSFYVASQLVGANASTGNIVSEITLRNASGTFAIGDVLSDGTNSEKIISYDSATGDTLTQPVVGTIPENTIVTNGSITATLVGRVKQFDSPHNILIYTLPHSIIQTVRGVGNAIDTSYFFRKTFTATTSTGSATFTAGASEVFAPFNSTDYLLTIEDATGSAGTILNTQLTDVAFGAGDTTITFTNIPVAAHTVKLTATLFKQVAQERTKTLTNNSGTPLVVSAPAPTTISLGKPDIYKIISITEIPISGPNVDLTDRYTLDNGQRDNLYDIGSITLKLGSGAPASTSAVHVVFSYFTHSANGDYFSVDSYVNFDGTENWYSNIPSYTSVNGVLFQLRDVLDFRPVIDNNGTTFTSPNSLVKPNSDIFADYFYYLNRIDKIYLDFKGLFHAIKGTASLNPVPPGDPRDGMVLYIVALGAFTFTEKDVSVQYIDNRGYTMNAIGKLEKRIANLEYLTSLNLLEQKTSSLEIIDTSTGLNRFKNGFVVDPFTSTGVADSKDGDYQAAIDFDQAIMRPRYVAKNIPFVFNIPNSSNYDLTTSLDVAFPHTPKPDNKLITNKYKEVVLIDQPFASDEEKVNPYAVYGWIGSMVLDPPTDTWFDTEQLPTISFNDTSQYDSVVNSLGPHALGTIWNSWQIDWTGIQYTATNPWHPGSPTQRLVRTGVATSIVSTISNIVVDNKTVSLGVAPFIKSRYVKFTAHCLKPRTRFFPFFDTIAVSAYCKPIGTINGSSSDPSTNLGDPLISDGAGKVVGWFLVPPQNSSDTLHFKTGQRIFRITDDSLNGPTPTSFADATYTASGVLQINQETITSTITAEVQRTNVTQTQLITAIPYTDPLAQAFLINMKDANGVSLPGAFISKLDLYFSCIDDNIPVTIQIRTMLNGTPTQTIVPYSETILSPFTGSIIPSTLDPNTIYSSEDATVPTTVVFKSPIYLQNNTEYAIVIMSNSNQYCVFTAVLGNKMLNSDRVISKQPYAGAFFKSKNASTWTPEQTEDLKFTLYRCFFDTNTNGATALFTNDDVPAVTLGSLPFETSNGSNLIRVLHPNHGKPNGGNVLLTIPKTESANNYNGITAIQITPNITGTSDGFATFVISNVDLNSYTITTLGTATASGRTGPDGVIASDDMAMDLLYPLFQQLTFAGTQLNWSIKTTSTQSIGGTQSAFNKDVNFNTIEVNNNIEFINPRMIASPTNESLEITGSTAFDKKSLVFQANLITTTDSVSSVIDTARMSGIVVQNLINNSSPSNTNVDNFDDEQESMVTGTDIAFNGSTNQISWTSSDFSKFKTNRYIAISGSSVLTNNTTFPALAKITAIDFVGKTITIDPTTLVLTTHSVGDTITVKFYDNFVDETAPNGASNPARYICRQVTLQDPANSLTVYLTALRPPDAIIDVYFKALVPYSTATWYSLPWVKMSLDPQSPTASAQNPNDFKEYIWTANQIGTFISFAVKIVMKSTNSAQVPVFENFRGIALAT